MPYEERRFPVFPVGPVNENFPAVQGTIGEQEKQGEQGKVPRARPELVHGYFVGQVGAAMAGQQRQGEAEPPGLRDPLV